MRAMLFWVLNFNVLHFQAVSKNVDNVNAPLAPPRDIGDRILKAVLNMPSPMAYPRDIQKKLYNIKMPILKVKCNISFLHKCYIKV